MKILVTGAAGFIGSHLSEALLNEGHTVIGLDCFTPFYDVKQKHRNLQSLVQNQAFELVEGDLLDVDLDPVLEGVEVVYHHAAQAGVRTSWGSQFFDYTRLNIDATQRLLEAVKHRPLRKFIYASSSSVYGRAEIGAMSETALPQPLSPYGVTKLAAEHLMQLYHWNYGVPSISLRYFTVFGPRQRPDMAFHRFIARALRGEPIDIYGDGKQSRDFTFVADAVAANLAAMDCDAAGEVLNIGGGARIDLHGVLEILEKLIGQPIQRNYKEAMMGDMRHTSADISRAAQILNYQPRYPLAEGLARQVAWHKEILGG